MQSVDSLESLRSSWLNRLTPTIAKAAVNREIFRQQLEQFFDLLKVCIDTGDPAWLDTILQSWSSSMTQTDLDGGPNNLTPFIREVMVLTHEVIRDNLPSEKALNLITDLAPCFAYSFEKSAALELEARLAYISNQLQQAQDTLERLERSKSDFIAVAAHELKTPLTLVEGYTAMLKDDFVRRNPDPYAVSLLTGIHSGTGRLKSIIEDMIDVSLLDNRMLTLNFQPIWLDRLLKILTVELKPSLAERRIKLEMTSFPGFCEMTFADPERILQALRNVISNAIKFTPDGGSIFVDGRTLPGFIEILIKDTGIGISPENQGSIFEKFSSLGNTSLHSSGKVKFKGGGAGLGLHIAKGILETHGGAIWAESPGYDEATCPGSTFHVLVPQRNEPPDEKMARMLAPLIHPMNNPSSFIDEGV